MLYQKPKLELLTLAIDDVICESPGTVVDKGNQDPDNPGDGNDLGNIW